MTDSSASNRTASPGNSTAGERWFAPIWGRYPVGLEAMWVFRGHPTFKTEMRAVYGFRFGDAFVGVVVGRMSAPAVNSQDDKKEGRG